MSAPTKVLYGFHALGVRLKTAPKSVLEIYFDSSRRDARMRQFIDKAKEIGARLIEADSARLVSIAGSLGHQGVVARVTEVKPIHSLDDLLDSLTEVPLLLVLDGITDPHNLGACLRVADGAGVHRSGVVSGSVFDHCLQSLHRARDRHDHVDESPERRRQQCILATVPLRPTRCRAPRASTPLESRTTGP